MSSHLDPEFAEAAAPILAMMASAPAPKIHDIESRRAGLKQMFSFLFANAPQFPEVQVSEYQIKSFDGADITVYHLRNQGIETALGPAVISVHGGGMIAGSTADFVPALKANVHASGIHFFDVEYRLAPEFPHPTPTEDVYATLLWVHENAEKFNIDKKRIGITGNSAGGGIAAGVSLMARDRGLQPPLAKQILVYPMLDSRTVKPIPGLDVSTLIWTLESNITGWTALLGDKLGSDDVSPYASPALAKSVEGLPPTYIDVGTLDLFRDEDIEYAARLAKANNLVELHVYPGVPHGWEGAAPQITLTTQARANRLRALTSF